MPTSRDRRWASPSTRISACCNTSKRRLAGQTEPLAQARRSVGLAGVSAAPGPMAHGRLPRGGDAARRADHDFPSCRRKTRRRGTRLAAGRGPVPAGHDLFSGLVCLGRPAIVLSHDGRLSINDPAMVKMAKTLAEDGYVVCVAEHASGQAADLRQIENLNSFYGIGDMVALPPLRCGCGTTCGPGVFGRSPGYRPAADRPDRSGRRRRRRRHYGRPRRASRGGGRCGRHHDARLGQGSGAENGSVRPHLSRAAQYGAVRGSAIRL